MAPKIIAVIPVYERELLLPFTIKRLLEKNQIFKVICCGNKTTDKEICLKSGAEWVEVDNNPLGNKWNKGFKYSEQYNPDGILFVGSSDWISENWIKEAWNYIKNDEFGMVGKKDFYMVDVSIQKSIKYCKWLGYPCFKRQEEPIGTGRLISRKFLKAIDYTPFEKDKNSGMDYFMYHKCLFNNFKVKLINDDKFKFLSISTNAWINKHKFYRHYTGALIRKEKNIIQLLNNYLMQKLVNTYKKKDNNFIIYLKFIFLLNFLKGNKNINNYMKVYNNKAHLLNIHEINELNKEFPEIIQFSNIIQEKINVKEKFKEIKNNRIKLENFILNKNKNIFEFIFNFMQKEKNIDKLKIIINNYQESFVFTEEKYYIDEIIYYCVKTGEKNLTNNSIDNFINNLDIIPKFSKILFF